ncbi:MAG: citramalate synthase [Candidatus Glassbacteria bacterium]|nr:citramalate synthase [Candidatus Glassbacteria bacterium]
MGMIEIYDTTLRDGTQAEEISFTLEDKLRIAGELDRMGIHYIEGGYPGSNPKDALFFEEVRKSPLKFSKPVAFGMTRRVGARVETDPIIASLLSAETEVVAVVGKSWELHVTEALRTDLEENLKAIADSVSFLKKQGKKVFYDAEHFFDGYRDNPEYCLKTVKVAAEAGADRIILCDTNGGSLPSCVAELTSRVKSEIKVPLGIHAHNDSELAVANSLAAVEAGAVQVQGTINGYGERCGNANLISIIPGLMLKMGLQAIDPAHLKGLRELARVVNELANLPDNKRQAFVGDSAFAHKGGMHVSAVARNPKCYEHIDPELVGNHRRVLVSDLSGRSNILYKAEEFGIDIQSKDPAVKEILERLKLMEHQGFQYEGAEASFELLMKRAMGSLPQFFELLGFRVIDEKSEDVQVPVFEETTSEATIMVRVDNQVEHTAAKGNGPVNAIDNALRKALEKFYPELGEVSLLDYKVRVLPKGKGTGSMVRVLIESGDHKDKWGTVGVSFNIVEASWQALSDSVIYKLLKERQA